MLIGLFRTRTVTHQTLYFNVAEDTAWHRRLPRTTVEPPTLRIQYIKFGKFVEQTLDTHSACWDKKSLRGDVKLLHTWAAATLPI